MPLTSHPRPASLREVLIELKKDPAKDTYIASGSVTEPQNYALPRCQINVMQSGTVPAAAASRLGVRSSAPKFKVSLMHMAKANPGTNSAVYLTNGIYETNQTFDAEGFAADRETRNPANYMSPWKKPADPRVYFVMPDELAPLNESAEREHCMDFILAYKMTLEAVDSVFQSLNGVTMEGFLSMNEAKEAMIKRVGETLAPALRPVACNPEALNDMFKRLTQKSRDGRDGKGWHSFGLEVVNLPQAPGEVVYLTGKSRDESGRIYLKFTKGQTQINQHPSEKVIVF
jgi:hypothetical protein